MRVIEAFDEAVRTVAVSPDGRFVAAAVKDKATIWHWASGTKADGMLGLNLNGSQLRFTVDGTRLLFTSQAQLHQLIIGLNEPRQMVLGQFAGGIGVSPDGKTLVAAQTGHRQMVRLERWELPVWRQVPGFDFWSPFVRLVFSPNGEFIAGIDRDSFELRFAVTGGLNGRHRLPGWAHYLFIAFPQDSQTCVFGRDSEFHIMETRAGNILKRVTSPGQMFFDAAFVGSGRHLVTVDGTSVMRMWSAETWEVVREYDWAAGGLTCVTATADGLAGVCGTDTGQLVAFDVDE